MNAGLPPSDTSSPATTPDNEAVPVAEAFVVPSYTLLLPVIPIIAKGTPVMSPDNIGRVNV